MEIRILVCVFVCVFLCMCVEREKQTDRDRETESILIPLKDFLKSPSSLSSTTLLSEKMSKK